MTKTQSHQNEDLPDLSLVVPLFNEEVNIPELYRRIARTMSALAVDCELILVNDGSKDATPLLIDELAERDPRIVPIHLSRNFGHQAAICAGIDFARGRAVMLLDGDLQDPPELAEPFLEAWRSGFDVVFAVRAKRKEHAVKRLAYATFYRLLRATSDLDIPLDSGDFCLMDRKVVDVLKHLPERSRFVRGLRTFVGFRQIGIRYEREARHGGTPKYSLRSLARLAVDGLVSFSNFPLNFVTYLGLGSALLAMATAGLVITDAVYHRTAPQGWASTVLAILCMGSVQLISLGIIGEYVRRIFVETKGRPTYIVSRFPCKAVAGRLPVGDNKWESKAG